MKPGDEILIRAKLINVRESDNEATVGFDSTTTAVVPLGAVGGPANVSTLGERLREVEHNWRVRAMKLLDKMTTASERMQQQTLVKCAEELAAALVAEGHQRVVDAIVKGNVETLLAMQAAAPSLHKEGLLGNDVLFNDEEINTLLTGRFGVSSVTGLDDIAWLTGQLNKLAELKCAALHKEGAGGDAELRKIVEWAKTKTPCASHYECLLADLMGLLAKRAATDAPKETGKP